MRSPQLVRRSLFLLPLLAVFLLAATSAPAQSQQYVFNRAIIPTGKTPTGIVVVDVNSDNLPDMLIINNEGSVSVFLGQPGGTFGPKTDFPTASGPFALVTGDFNGDGKVDLAVTTSCGLNCGSVSILLGNGDGTFQPHQEFPVGTNAEYLIVGDFNHDGKLDVAVDGFCGQTCGVVSVLLGKGDGTFQSKTDYSLGGTPAHIVGGDFNRDSNLDLLVAVSGANNIAVLLGNGDGTFQAPVNFPSPDSPSGIAAIDFDGDMIIDLVVSHDGAPWPVTFLKGNGDGTFQPERQILTMPLPGFESPTLQISALDLNLDGRPDLIFTAPTGGGLLISLGNGDGTFQASVPYAAGGYPATFAMIDVNGDGNRDLEVLDQESNFVSILLGNGDGTFSPRTTLPVDVPGINLPYAISGGIADFNGDGIPDLAIGNSDGSLSILLGKRKGQYQAPASFNANGAASLSVADFNGDGHPDLALGNGSGAVILLGNGDGTFAPPVQVVTTSAQGFRGLTVGDFNHDGKPDLVVLANAFFQSNPLYIALGNGDGTFQPARQFWTASSPLPTGLAVGDFNRDGNLDLVVTLNPVGIAVMLGNGDGTFQPPVIYPGEEVPTGLTVADLNGDGILDIIVAGDHADVYLGKGDGTFNAPVYYDAGNFPSEVAVGDFNADGKIDLAVAAQGPGAVGDIEILLGNGDGTFQSPVEIADRAPLSPTMAVADLNQDATPDILVVGGGTGVSLFLSGPIASLSPTSVNFGSVTPGSVSAPQLVTLANNGNAPLVLTSVTTATPTTATFALNNGCGASVPVRSSCQLSITFTPPSIGPIFGGILSLSDNAPRYLQTVPLVGSGAAPPPPHPTPDFSLTLASGSSASATVAAGATANYAFTVTPIAGFNQSIAFTCSGAPTAATCTASPTTLAFSGNTPATMAVQITTTARSAGLRIPPAPGPERLLRLPSLFFAIAIALLVATLRIVRARTFVLPRLATLILLLAALMTITACGGGTSGAPPNSGSGIPGTPAGSYTIKVIGTSGTGATMLQHSTDLTLVVN